MRSGNSLADVTNDALSVAESVNAAADALKMTVDDVVSKVYAGCYGAVKMGCPSLYTHTHLAELKKLAGVCLALAAELEKKVEECRDADK